MKNNSSSMTTAASSFETMDRTVVPMMLPELPCLPRYNSNQRTSARNPTNRLLSILDEALDILKEDNDDICGFYNPSRPAVDTQKHPSPRQ
jgi:hypothetical protein